MNLLNALIFLSSLSFMDYGISYFKSPKMKAEFKRFGLEKAGTLTAILEILWALGLLVGFKFYPILLISAVGLAILMLPGFAIRIKCRDTVWVSLPVLFFMFLNATIFLCLCISN